MCGIAGFKGRFPGALLDLMSLAVAHRDPDGEGSVLLRRGECYTEVGLAHRRLAILDLSADGRQPMTVDCDRCGCSGHAQLSLTYNGEMYNCRELR
jgi:asparagine synthase (glutamine-hydrolysing)